MPNYSYFVYILASTFQRLYIGVTNDLEGRLRQDKSRSNPDSFTSKYNIHHLVYFEHFQYIHSATTREKELKGWLRIRKLQIITATNPEWRDLSANWGKQIEPLAESQRRKPTMF